MSSGSRGVPLTVVTYCWLRAAVSRKTAGLFFPCLQQQKAPKSALPISTPPNIPQLCSLALLSPKVPTSEEDLSVKLNPFSFLVISILIIAPIYRALTPCQTPQPGEAGPTADRVERKQRLISAVPMSLNGKTPDTRGTNTSGFPNTKEKMLSGHAPPSSLPQGTEFLGRPCSHDTTGFPVLK